MSSSTNNWVLSMCVVGIVVFVCSTQGTPSPLEQEQPIIGTSVPTHLSIPRINVDTDIEQVGYTATGAMAVPRGPDTVGWLNTSSIPGATGTAVMDGHRGWKNKPAVFDHLADIHVGDRIYVTDAQQRTTSFVVRAITRYASDADASEVFGGATGSHLNLVTCDGDWDIPTQNYSKRLVVFSEKES